MNLLANFTEMATYIRSLVNKERFYIQLKMNELPDYWLFLKGLLKIRKYFGMVQLSSCNGSHRLPFWPPLHCESFMTSICHRSFIIKNIYITTGSLPLLFPDLGFKRKLHRLELCQKLHSKNQKFGCLRFKKH